MKIKSEIAQLEDKQNELSELIKWQEIATNKAQKRYLLKKEWGLLAFWIGNDTDTLRYIMVQERAIKYILIECYDDIVERLRILNNW